MLQLRPTFSESWYRVATLKPRLRAGAQMSRQYYRGERWYVVRDPAGNQFHRLSDPAYRFVGLLDGRRTVLEAWDLVGGQLADDAPTQPEVIQILSQLYAANLLETDITPDATVLLRRHKQMVKRKIQGRMMNVLFPRIPLWDPDQFLKRWLPVARVLFSRLGAVIWLVVVALALVTVVPQWADIRAAANHALDLQHNWENIFYLYATFIFIKLIHELGHAFSCRRFGGECHELGIMLLVLVPTPYVDASSAWAFANKWHRIFVGAAGMIVELFFACLCAFIWRYTNPVTYPVINQLAYNAMFIASVSTLMFNANPLLRYDGYYILSDMLEIPNLRQKSTEYAMGLIKRHVFGVKLQQPLPTIGQRVWLFLYAVCSSAYRIFIGVAIILLVTYKVPVLGVLMAIGGVATWLLVPVFKVGKYLLLDPELHRKRTWAISFSSAVAAALVIIVGLVRFPMHVEFAGIVQPDDPTDIHGVAQSGKLTMSREGRVVKIDAEDGQAVRAGQLILELTNPVVQHDIEQARWTIDEIHAKDLASRGAGDLTEAVELKYELQVWQGKLNDALKRNEQLKVKAPFAGRLIAPRLHEMENTYLHRGEEIGSVAVLSNLVIKGDIDQTDAQLVLDSLNSKAQVDVRLAGLLGKVLQGGALTLPEAAVQELTHPSLGPTGGGEIQVDPRDPKGMRPAVSQFEAHVKLANLQEQYFPGQKAYVRLTLDRRPLAWQWIRRFLQLIQSHDNGKWI
ncbi:MAG: biotin/lipoyl-binding protein [Planctomycetota bacterium]|nr:biotin/lipoyl-binding protein [Planctomycetota bacterium]